MYRKLFPQERWAALEMSTLCLSRGSLGSAMDSRSIHSDDPFAYSVLGTLAIRRAEMVGGGAKKPDIVCAVSRAIAGEFWLMRRCSNMYVCYGGGIGRHCGVNLFSGFGFVRRVLDTDSGGNGSISGM